MGQGLGKLGVELDGDHPARAGHQFVGEKPQARANFHDGVLRRQPRRFDNPAQDRRLDEEVLPQPLSGPKTEAAQPGFGLHEGRATVHCGRWLVSSG